MHIQWLWFAARGTAVMKMAVPLWKMKRSLCFNKTKCVKWVHWHYLSESGEDPPSEPSICAFYKQFCETCCFCKWKCSLLQNVFMVLEYQLDMCRVTRCIYWRPISGKISFDSYSLMSKCVDVVSCFISSKWISEIVKIIHAHAIYVHVCYTITYWSVNI